MNITSDSEFISRSHHDSDTISDREDLSSVANIPTSDPQEALRFCQVLAEILQEKSLGTAFQIPEGDRLSCSISIVLPIYNEEGNILKLYSRLVAVMENTEPNFEIVFVNDGSKDLSLKIIEDLVKNDKRISIIDLARNFGHQIAISAGMDYALGNAVVIMDADLQDPPEVLPMFISKWQEGYDVVYAIRENRKENWILRTAYQAFYRILQQISYLEIPLDSGDFCIMDRRVVDILVSMPERNRFVRGIRTWIGLKQIGLAYERQERNAGKPKYTLKRLVYLALDGLISFSYLPLRIITIIGFSVSFLSILLAAIYTIQKLTMGLSPPGFATTIVAIFFLAGIQLITLGVMGEYIGRIFEEVKSRPLYVVRKVIQPNSKATNANINVE